MPVLVILVLAGLGVLAFDRVYNDVWDGKNDLKLGVISKDRLALVSVSSERKMINVMKLDGKVMVWIPKGLSWYQADRVERLLGLEKDGDELARLLFFYNFGFISDKIVYLEEVDDWRNDKVLLEEIGLINWVRFRRMSGEMLYKEENVTENLADEAILLDEVMMRDFADNRVLKGDLRINTMNTTEISGLANFLATKLEWAGFSVIGVDNVEAEVKNCLMVKGENSENEYSLKVLESILGCQVSESKGGQHETELYFGEGFAEMLKYSSYVRTF